MLSPVRYALATDKVRHVGEAVAAVVAETARPGQGRRRGGGGRDRAVAGRHDPQRRGRTRRARPLRRRAGECRARFPFRGQRQGRRRLCLGRACHAPRAAQQPHRRQCDGAALRDRAVRPRAPALDAPCRLSGGLRVPQLHRRGVRGRARPNARSDRPRRRLVRHEAADLCRILLHPARGPRARPPGQMDRRPLGQLSVRQPWPRRRDDGRAGARPRRQFPRGAPDRLRQSRRHLRGARPADPQCGQEHPRRLQDPADRGLDQMRVHQHDAGRRLSRRRPARGQLLHGAAGRDRRGRDRDRPRRAAPEQPHPARGDAVQGAERHHL